MSKSLTEIAQQLTNAKHKTKAVAEKISDVKVQLIYDYQGSLKSLLYQEIAPKLKQPNYHGVESLCCIDWKEAND